MKLLLAEVKKVSELIRRLDEDEITDKTSIDKAKETLRRYYDVRESPLIVRGQMIKDKHRNDRTADAIRQKVEEIVMKSLAGIEASGYLGLKAKFPLKRGRGRPVVNKAHVPRNPRARVDLPVKRFRFSISSDYSYILDEDHRPPEYKISMYEGLTAEKAVDVIKALLDKAEIRDSEGWVKSKSWWRGAFQKGVYKRFHDEQIERGTKKKGHMGEWRFFTSGEFDMLSPIGKFHKRTSVN